MPLPFREHFGANALSLPRQRGELPFVGMRPLDDDVAIVQPCPRIGRGDARVDACDDRANAGDQQQQADQIGNALASERSGSSLALAIDCGAEPPHRPSELALNRARLSKSAAYG